LTDYKKNFGTETLDATRNSTIDPDRPGNANDKINKLRKRKFKSSKNMAGLIADTGRITVYENEPKSAMINLGDREGSFERMQVKKTLDLKNLGRSKGKMSSMRSSINDEFNPEKAAVALPSINLSQMSNGNPSSPLKILKNGARTTEHSSAVKQTKNWPPRNVSQMDVQYPFY